jgi:hypothetical protein
MKRRTFLTRLAGLPILGRLLPKSLVVTPAPVVPPNQGYAFASFIFPVIKNMPTDFNLAEILSAQPMTGIQPNLPLTYSPLDENEKRPAV